MMQGVKDYCYWSAVAAWNEGKDKCAIGAVAGSLAGGMIGAAAGVGAFSALYATLSRPLSTSLLAAGTEALQCTIFGGVVGGAAGLAYGVAKGIFSKETREDYKNRAAQEQRLKQEEAEIDELCENFLTPAQKNLVMQCSSTATISRRISSKQSDFKVIVKMQQRDNNLPNDRKVSGDFKLEKLRETL